jgi:glycosyltransferase involved in cell wall biosynthesis
LLTLFRQRHAASAFDLVIIYNLNSPQVACGLHAVKRLGLPVIVEYEDDAIVDVSGNEARGARARLRLRAVNRMIGAASGCIGVSPFRLDRFPRSIPKLLLRGVVTEDIVSAAPRASAERSDWVTFSGALYRRKGLEPLISAWRMARPPGWELHIAGHGELADRLREMCAGDATVVFHGLIDRATNADLLNRSKICINPHDLSATPGNVFAFKIIEYLAAGAHVLTTPMGPLEPELERGITYLEDNTPAVIAATLRRVIEERTFDREASGPARQRYGPAPVAQALDDLVGTVLAASRTAHGQGRIAERSDGPRDPKLDRPPAGSASSLLSEDS